uniref:Uncharacterized protein n=1 Tax=Setaria digitata TaxID=48799 RepID=A0A915Q775_9BILA
MEIHHRLYEKSINYGTTTTTTTTATTANDLVPVLSDNNETSGMSENSNFGASTSSLVKNTGTFASVGRGTIINEFPGYSSTSPGLLNYRVESDLSLGLTVAVTSAIVAEGSDMTTENDLNANHHQCQQQQSRRTLAQNPDNNICGIVGTAESERLNKTMVITTNRNGSNRNGGTNANTNSNCNCAITTTNEPNFSHRISKVPHFSLFLPHLSGHEP